MSQHRFRDQRRGAACFSFFFSGTVKHAAGKNTFSTSIPSHTSLVERERERERRGRKDGWRWNEDAWMCVPVCGNRARVRVCESKEEKSSFISLCRCACTCTWSRGCLWDCCHAASIFSYEVFFFLFWCAKIARFRLEIIFNEKVYFKQTPRSNKAMSFNEWYDVIMSY